MVYLSASCNSQDYCQRITIIKSESISLEELEFYTSFIGLTVSLNKISGEVVRPIQFTSKNKERYEVYITRHNGWPTVDTSRTEAYALKVFKDNFDSSVDSYKSMHRIDSFLKSLEEARIIEFHSQLHLGEAFELKFGEGCSIWYVPKVNNVSESMKIYLNKLTPLDSSWYFHSYK